MEKLLSMVLNWIHGEGCHWSPLAAGYHPGGLQPAGTFPTGIYRRDNQKHRPVMVHRAPFGSMERFVAVLIEHTAGKFPLWLTPDQVAILPISEKFNDYAHEVKQYLKRYDIRAIVDERNEKIGRKIRDNEMKRIPYMLVVGEKEAENKEVAVRKQGEGDKGTMKFEEFAKKMNEEVQNMINKW